MPPRGESTGVHHFSELITNEKQSNETSSIVREDELNVLERFEEIRPLTLLNDSSIPLQWRGEDYIMSSFEDLREDEREIVFGLWQKNNGMEKPLGIADIIVSGDHAIVQYRKFGIFMDDVLPDRFKELDESVEPGEVPEGFIMSPEVRSTGISDVFLAGCLATLESIGIEKVVFKGDITIRTEDEPGFLPRFKSNDTPIVEKQSYTSFYNKYATTQTIDEEFLGEVGDYRYRETTVETRISSMQESLLHEAFGHYKQKN